ncbi:MAG: NAD(P)/FAD-dependent oxidoreductase [Fidelibacterota bacterium]|nr:MAG: NAD(P)/FAD-dependent oxidoreductase [Candidatus Neomarinimicrobiota bacterium]
MYDLIVIGAGAVGLSVGRYFQVERGFRCLVVEKEARIGQGISSRNSEVIHAGLYYPSNSLKALLCVEGKKLLYHYLEKNGLPFRRCGKYIVATPGQEQELQDLFEQGRANGVDDLELVTGDTLHAEYAQLAPCPALSSPSTGILSADAWMRHLAGEFQAGGGDLALQSTFCAMTPGETGYDLTMSDAAGETITIHTDRVINATGLDALNVASLAGFPYVAQEYSVRHCKGSYFKVPGARGLFHNLIYPLPTPNSLGIHIRLDLLNEVLLGPDAEYLPGYEVDYTVDPALESEFRRQVCRFWPGVKDYPLEPDWAGIRPHLFIRDEFHHDFYIKAEDEAGCPGWVNLLGIDSPGLTAAMAMGPYIDRLWD